MASPAPPQQALDLVQPRGFERRFVVARNPDPDSSLPYLLRVPVGAGLTLKAAEPWPLSSRVYCHPLERPVDGELDVLQEVGVRMCAWRGRAVDLVLDRARHNRSQFVFTTARGRPAVFWQTPFVARRARPGGRVPRAPASGAGGMTMEVDTRERRPYGFAGREVELSRAALFAGDYAVRGPSGIHAAVERKTGDDFVTSATSGALAFAMADLSALPAAAVVVEDRYSALVAHSRVRPGFMAELIARLQVRAPNVPIVYAESRSVAEDWTYRFLATAWRELGENWRRRE
jgi:ERCC4 domain-containing protein